MTNQLRFTAILFDLDGTLTDPFLGISRSVNYALGELGRPALSDAELRPWVGPPLHASFVRALGNVALADAAVEHYRRRYAEIGLYENAVYAGIPALLDALRAAGARLFVATSKIRPPTERILDHFGLAGYFERVGATDPADRAASKAGVIADLLPVLGADRARAVLVGDTVYDILGARAHAMPCVAVGYGYGPPDDLRAAAPLALAATVGAVRDLLLG